MSLYRTWRPQSFADLVGQDAVVQTLTAALESGKLAHAYLFSGPRGSGKTSAAKILARCIDCVAGPTATPDNTCENCRAILAGTALDVLEIDAASNRGIDEIRALRDAVKFAPASMRMKVYIIDEAHMLTKEGANAFLKTLEEPPPHAVFILATTEPEKLPVTVLSRCQRYAFRRIAVPVMIARMAQIAVAEGITVDDGALAAIAYRAEGGLRDALTMLEQAAAFAAGTTVTAETLDRAFGATGREFALAVLDAAIARDPAAGLNAIERASDAGADVHVLLRSLIAAFRNLLVARVDSALLERDLARDDASAAAQRAQSLSQTSVVRALRVFGDASTLARTGGNPRLELETALLRYILSPEDADLDSLASRVSELEERAAASRYGAAQAPSAPPPQPSQAAPAAQRVNATVPGAVGAEGMSLQKVRSAWQSVRAKVQSEYAPLRGPLSGASVDDVSGGTITVVARNNGADEAVLRQRVRLLEAAVADVLGVPMKIAVRVESSPRPKGPPSGGTAMPKSQPAEDADVLFQYANERIRER